LRHEVDYSALLFLRADDPATMNAGLVALMSVRKKHATTRRKIAAVLSWFEAHPTWLMILDNVDDDEAVGADQADSEAQERACDHHGPRDEFSRFDTKAISRRAR
jgi:hypothetical protein